MCHDVPLPRSRVIPPACLSHLVLPWVAADVEVVKASTGKKIKTIEDQVAKNFLNCLMWLKDVCLQDMAVLHDIYPNLPVFKAHLVNHFEDW